MTDLGRTLVLVERALPAGEFAVMERRTVRHRLEFGRLPCTQVQTEVRLEAIVFRDLREGRGEARFSVSSASDAEVSRLARAAAAAAGHTIGPPWRMPPPSAPARVAVADLEVLAAPERALGELAERAATALPKGAKLASGRAEVVIEKHRVATSSGFEGNFQATWLELSATAESGDRRFQIAAAARRPADLRLATAAAEALALGAFHAAPPPTAGRYDLIFRPGAIVLPAWGWLRPVVAQADGLHARLGLSRYRSGGSIYSRELRGDPLGVSSDGTRDFAPLSAPFAEWGAPVRRFPLVAEGRAEDVALDLREAGLRGRESNGGVRNLEVATGSLSDSALLELRERSVLEVISLDWLDISPYGQFSAGIGAAREKGASGGLRRGGEFCGDVFDLFARTQFTTSAATRAWYRGPKAWRVDDVAVFG